MTPTTPMIRRGLWGIFLVSLAILVLEVALTRVLSVVMWYHFAFVVISLAMLGLAVSGILLYLVPALVRNAPALIPWACRLAAVATVFMMLYLARTPFRTEAATEIFSREVAIFYLVALMPFLFAGFAISAAFARYARQINTLYFADLVGAGIGCALVVLLLGIIGAPATILLAAAIFCAGSLFLRRETASPALDTLLMLAAVGLSVWAFQAQGSTGPSSENDLRHPFEPRYQKGLSDWQFKDRLLYSGWNSHSRIKIYEPAPPAGQQPSVRVISIDGNATTGIVHIEGEASAATIARQAPYIRTWVGAAPYSVLPPQPKVMIIGPGGGRDILSGLLFGARVSAIEVNGLIFDLMTKGPFAEWSGQVYRAPGVTAVHDEARSWVRRTGEKFDLIQATLVDTWAATASGAFTLAENSLYTVEAFEDFFSHLTEDGIVHFTRWHRQPPRESLRAVVLATEVMQRRGIPNPGKHIIVGYDGQGRIDGDQPYTMMLWSKKEFTQEQINKLAEYSSWRKVQDPRLTLDPAYVPGAPVTEDVGRYLTHPDHSAFIDAYPYDISATTDDRPFFFNAVRLKDVALFRREVYQNEQAVVVLVTVLATVLGIVALAFLLPFGLTLPRIRRASGPGTGASLLYFCGIGIGFMLVEIPVLQRFGLYLGHPTYALSTILATLLFSTGVGSALAGWWAGRHPVSGARVALALIIVASAALVIVVPQVISLTLARPLWFRILVTVALLFPLGILMGFPLPLGVRALDRGRAALIPWAWGMNGASSVLASVLAVAIGIYAGFTIAIIAGAAFYALALFTVGRLPGTAPLAEVQTAPVVEPEPPPQPPPPDAPLPLIS
jgi:hypothetical protein